jgi:hypothetical protein
MGHQESYLFGNRNLEVHHMAGDRRHQQQPAYYYRNIPSIADNDKLLVD